MQKCIQTSALAMLVSLTLTGCLSSGSSDTSKTDPTHTNVVVTADKAAPTYDGYSVGSLDASGGAFFEKGKTGKERFEALQKLAPEAVQAEKLAYTTYAFVTNPDTQQLVALGGIANSVHKDFTAEDVAKISATYKGSASMTSPFVEDNGVPIPMSFTAVVEHGKVSLDTGAGFFKSKKDNNSRSIDIQGENMVLGLNSHNELAFDKGVLTATLTEWIGGTAKETMFDDAGNTANGMLGGANQEEVVGLFLIKGKDDYQDMQGAFAGKKQAAE